MKESVVIAHALSDLNDTIKSLGNSLYEVRHWYTDEEYYMEYRGTWAGCIAFLRKALIDHNEVLMNL